MKIIGREITLNLGGKGMPFERMFGGRFRCMWMCQSYKAISSRRFSRGLTALCTHDKNE